VDREVTLADYWRVLWSGRWLILATTVAGAVLGLLFTFVTSTSYTAEAQVFLGQATTTGGVPVSTPGTNPLTAATVLEGDEFVNLVAERTALTPSRVRAGVAFSIPRAPGAAAGNQPSVANITFTDSDAEVAQRVVNAYAQVVLTESNRSYIEVNRVFRERLRQLQAREEQFARQVARFQDLLLQSRDDPSLVGVYQTLLFSSVSQLANTRDSLDSQQLALARNEQIEAPRVISLSETPTSSTSAPNRARTMLFAAVLGLLAGIIVTFVWKGSPAGRARPITQE
jgi:uncharacterized protein involved in exopolysaccharide biosynthesis